MKLDKTGYNLIAQFEGLSLKPYKCSAGVPTIGYGNTFYSDGTKVTMDDKSISKGLALNMLVDIADDFAFDVYNVILKPINQNQFNSLVSIAYNIGINAFSKSTLLKKVKVNPNDETIKNEFLKWNKANGKMIKGLTIRREKECEIYFK